MPEISVVMSCYNEESHVKRAISSIINQTFTDFEFIIIDDGSEDSTAQIIHSCASEEKRIRFFKNNTNLGLAASLNKGIKMANGKYIARMDADDVSLPYRLQKQVAYLGSHPNVDILGSNAELVSVNSIIKSQVMLSHIEIKKHLYTKTCLIHPSVMIKRSCFDIEGYDADLPWAEDHDLWLRWINKYTFANLEEAMIKYSVKDKITWKIFYYNHLVLIKNMMRQNVLFFKSPSLLKSFVSHLVKMCKQ